MIHTEDFIITIEAIDALAEKTAKLSPYCFNEHVELLVSELLTPKMGQGLLDYMKQQAEQVNQDEEAFMKRKENAIKTYCGLHPMVYIYEDEGSWCAQVHDPKNLNLLRDENYFSLIDLKVPSNGKNSIDKAKAKAHELFPTAFIDFSG